MIYKEISSDDTYYVEHKGKYYPVSTLGMAITMQDDICSGDEGYAGAPLAQYDITAAELEKVVFDDSY